MVMELMGGDTVHLRDFDFSDVQEVHVDSVGDLPDPNNQGERVLRDDHAYIFHEIVVGTEPLVYGNSTPIVGTHGSKSGYINAAGTTCLKATDKNVFATDMYFHCPGGEVLNSSGQSNHELQFERVSFSDAAGLGDIASLGTIDGHRVPAFKSCNFEDFAGGFTFDGVPDKIFFETCPFREVTASGVTCITFASSIEVDIVDFASNYFKNLQPDTECVRVETGATIEDIFQYRGTTHDTSVTKDNILVGQADTGAVGYDVQESYPLRNSAVVGELNLDSPTTITISSAGTYEQIGGTTSLGNESERVSKDSEGVFLFEGKKDVNVQLSAVISVESSNGDVIRGGIFKNGTLEPASEAEITVSGGGAPNTLVVTGIEDLTSGETLEIRLQNESAANNITVNEYNISFLG